MEAICNNRPLPWIKVMLIVEQMFHKECKLHKCKADFFCLHCQDYPICVKCIAGGFHLGHPHLRVFICTHKNAVQVEDVQKLLDVSGIHTLRNNGRDVIYLRNRRPITAERNGSVGTCLSCNFRFPSSSVEAQYCSIICKEVGLNLEKEKEGEEKQPELIEENVTRPKEEETREERTQNQETRSPSTSPFMLQQQQPCTNFRKRRRKMLRPIRAPFF
ncbi:hypothetical protein HPP92_008314 [Vanilla planifolia]|uniref:PLATZ transcription factor family protein n=1 Tax=Vanilla planifolia TaxID=51239 RepID=A0A835V3N0_VANPL|nr:hypothetical protein HPP92_008314 [Vanilla planifolia]